MCARDEECFGVLRLNLGDDFGLAVMVFSLWKMIEKEITVLLALQKSILKKL